MTFGNFQAIVYGQGLGDYAEDYAFLEDIGEIADLSPYYEGDGEYGYGYEYEYDKNEEIGVIIRSFTGTVISMETGDTLQDVTLMLLFGADQLVHTKTDAYGQFVIEPKAFEALEDLTIVAVAPGHQEKLVSVYDYVYTADELGNINIDFMLYPIPAAAYGTARVEGVVTLDEQAIEGATVYFMLEIEGYDYDEPEVFTAETDTYGRFAITLPVYYQDMFTAWAVYEPSEYARAVSEFFELEISSLDVLNQDFELSWVGIHPASEVRISTPAELALFLNGYGGLNSQEFILMGDISMAGMGTFTGRGHVGGMPFTGSFRSYGNNVFTISDLQLVPRDATELPETPGHNDFGFIRTLGNGAVIENVNFSGITYADSAVLATWNTAVGSIGLIAGRIAPNAVVSIRNVDIIGSSVSITGARAFDGKRIGGMVGFAEAGSILNISDANVGVTISLGTTGTSGGTRIIPSAGGFVGQTAGNVNIGGSANTVNLVTAIAGSGNARQFQHAGGAVGRITTPAASASMTIQNLVVTGTITTVQVAGGIVGSSTPAATGALTLNNVENRAAITATTNTGGLVGNAATVTITGGINTGTITSATLAGGIVGTTTSTVVGAVHIANVENRGNVTGTATATGGIIGTTAAVRIENASNDATISSANSLGGLIGTSSGTVTVNEAENNGALTSTGTGSATGAAIRGTGGIIGRMTGGNASLTEVTNYATVSASRGHSGGLIGRAQGPVTIANSHNRGVVNVTNTGNTAGMTGGFVGDITSSLTVTDSANHANVTGRNHTGGIVGQTPTAGATSTTFTGVQNNATTVHTFGGTRSIGGLIGFARNVTTITNAQNNANITHTAAGGNNSNHGGFIGQASGIVTIRDGENHGNILHMAAGRGRSGGFIGFSSNRVDISNAVNHGHVGSTSTATSSVANNNMGGIIGRVAFPAAVANRVVTLNNVENHGNIGFNFQNGATVPRHHAGGIIGRTVSRTGALRVDIIDALNTGNIHGSRTVGGIVAWADNINFTINGAINTGHVSSTSRATGTSTTAANVRRVGGIVGDSNRTGLVIINSANQGPVTTLGTTTTVTTDVHGVGGILGVARAGASRNILRSYNSGNVEGPGRATGGIVGISAGTGALLIEDVYNIGSVNGRVNASSGNGILGIRRGARINTMRRVWNAGNVAGRPIYASPVGGPSAIGADHNATVGVRFDMVYWDTSVHSAPAHQTVGGVPIIQPQSTIAGNVIQGVNTAMLTSGLLPGISSGAWRVNGWATIDQWGDAGEAWESYPYLAWQTGGELETRFFASIEPGADHQTVAPTTTVDFTWVHEGVRTFNPYVARTQGHAGNHQPRPEGNSSLAVSRAVGERLSVGLISPNGVVGFGENEFDVRITVVDYYTGELLTVSTIELNGQVIGTIGAAFLESDEIDVTDILDGHALLYLSESNWPFTQADLDRGRIEIRLKPAVIEGLRVEVRNGDLEAMPIIPTANLSYRQIPATPWISVASSPTPAPLHFNLSGLGMMVRHELFATAPVFAPSHMDPEPPFRISQHSVVNPDAAGTAADPFIIHILLNSIAAPSPLTLRVVHLEPTDDPDNEDGFIERIIPHGGPAGANPSSNLRVHLRNPEGVIGPGALGAATNAGTGVNLYRWQVTNTTTLTEIWVEPITPTHAIGGNTFRPSAVYAIGELWDGEESIITITMEREFPLTVRVVEEIQVLEGAEHALRRLIPSATLSLEIDDETTVNFPSTTGEFQARALDGETLIAAASGFITNTRDVFEEYEGETIYIELEREFAGSIRGFVMHEAMRDNPDVWLPISGASITIFDANGAVAATATSDANGFYEVFGLQPGFYTVLGSHTTYGSNFAEPTPVELPDDANAQANVFLDTDEDDDFMILVRVLAAGTGNNISSDATVELAYTNNVRNATYITPFQVIRVSRAAQASWGNGQITVYVPGFGPSTINVADRITGALGAYLLIEVTLDQIINNFQVRVVRHTIDGPLVPSATLTWNGANVPGNGTGVFTIDGVRVGDALYATSRGFTLVPHSINTADAAAGGTTIILRDEHRRPENIDVRVYFEGILLTTAILTHEGTNVPGNGTGLFNVPGVLIGDRVAARAPGLAEVERTINEADMARGYISITLATRVDLNNFTARVYHEGSLVTSAELRRDGGLVSGTGGVFTMDGVRIGNVLQASAGGLTTVLHTVNPIDAQRGYVNIHLLRDAGTNLRVEIHFRGQPVGRAFLRVDGGNELTTNNGIFNLADVGVGTVLAPNVPGFATLPTHTVNSTNFTDGYVIINLPDAPILLPLFTVDVVNVQNDLIPSATLAHENNNVTGNNTGRFTIAANTVRVGDRLTGDAVGFDEREQRVTTTDAYYAGATIQLNVSGTGVNLEVRITYNGQLIPGSSLTVAPTGTVAPEISNGQRTGRFTISTVSVGHRLTASSAGFYDVQHDITLADVSRGYIVINMYDGSGSYPGGGGYTRIDNLEVRVMYRNELVVGSLLTVAPYGTIVAEMYNEERTGRFTAHNVRIGHRLTASSAGFNNVLHDITPADANRGYIIINMYDGSGSYPGGGGYAVINNLEVRVMYDGQLLASSNLTVAPNGTVTPEMSDGQRTGRFTVGGVHLGYRLTATATGFYNVLHDITPADANRGFIIINMYDGSGSYPGGGGYTVINNLEVRVMYDGQLLAASTLTVAPSGTIVPEMYDGQTTGRFTVNGVRIGYDLTVAAEGFYDALHRITPADATRGYIVIDMADGGNQGGGGYTVINNLEVRVMYDGQLLAASTLTVAPSGTIVAEMYDGQTTGRFTVNGVRIGYDLTVSAEGFYDALHRITPADATRGYIVIDMADGGNQGGGGYTVINNLEVRVVNTAGALLPSAALASAGATIVPYGNGIFRVSGVRIGNTLRASALGYDTVYHTITAANAALGTITITLPGDGPADTGSGPDQGVGFPPTGPFTPREPQQATPTLITGQHIRYIHGFEDGTVRAEAALTRAQVAMILFRLLDDNNKYAPLLLTGRFSDVDDTTWYSQAVNYLAHIGVFFGYPDGTFRPNVPITRAELAAVMTRFFAESDSITNGFADVSPTHWAAHYVNLAYSRGWILGYPDGSFRPDNAITRAEAITLINRVLEREPNPADINANLAGTVIFTDLPHTHWAYYDIMEASIEHDFMIDEHGNEIWTWFNLPSRP